MKKASIKIGGMTCAACSSRVEKNLNKAEGVINASVNLTTERATVQFDTAIISLEKVKKIIEDTGYQVLQEVDKVSIKIGGMTCAACSSRVEKNLGKAEGIISASVNRTTETARVEYDTSRIGIKEIENIIKDTGYELKRLL